MNEEIKRFLKCDACGGFHLEDDVEMITIQFVKGKNCELSKDKIFNPTTIEKDAPASIKEDIVKENTDFLKDPNIVKLVNEDEKNEYLRKTNSGVPPAFISQYGNMFKKDGAQNSETR